MRYRPTRDDNEALIQKLADQYPRCFFADPKLRVPLKKDIIADLQKDGFPATREELSWVVDWYQSHFSYQYALQAGAKRIDLQGRPVETVTEPEQMAAKKKIQADKAASREREAALGPTAVLGRLHATGQITDDAVKKLDAPLPPPPAKKPNGQFDTLREAVNTVATVSASDAPAPLRDAMAIAALQFVIAEAEATIKRLKADKA